MSEKELNKLDRATLLNLAEEQGLTVTEQSAYAKLTFGDSPAKIYVARTAKVTRVDLSKFTVEHAAIRQVSREEAKAEKLGRVNAQLDFTNDEGLLLEAFVAACAALKLVPPAPKKVPKATKARNTETVAPVESEVEAAESAEVTETSEELQAEPVDEAAEPVEEQGEPSTDELDDIEASEPETTDFGAEFETTTEPPQEVIA